MSKPMYAKVQWWEVHYRWPGGGSSRIDRRRRSKGTCEKIAAELRATGNFEEVWIVEVNRVTRDLAAIGGNPRTARRG